MSKKLYLFFIFTGLFTISIHGALFSEEVTTIPGNPETSLTGRVLDFLEKNPIPEARITIKGTVFFTYSNKNGDFTFAKSVESFLSGNMEALTLSVSREGYRSKEVRLEKLQLPVIIEMEPRSIKLGQIEDIVVTASGLDDTGYNTPYATHVVTGQEIFSRDTENLNKVLVDVPSVAMVGNDHHSAPSIRGLARKRVLVTVDGIRMPSHRSVGAYLSFINPFNVESLEVIKGPFSTVYGSDALSGVINVTTKKNSSSGNEFQFNGALSSGYESVNDGTNFNLSAEGGIKDFDFILSSGWRKADNYKTGYGDKMPDSFYEESYLNFKSGLSLGKNQKIQFIYLKTDGNDIGKPAGEPMNTNKHPHDDHDIFSIQYTWSNISSWLHSLDLSFSRSHYVLTGEFTKIKKDKFIETHRELGGEDYAVSLKGNIITSNKFVFSLGFDGYFQENQHIRGQKNTSRLKDLSLIQSAALNEVPDASTRDYGFFLQGVYNPLKKLSINFGLRDDIITGSVYRESETVRTDDSALNGNIGVVYSLTPFMRLTGSLGTAYRIPSIKERYFIGQTPQGFNLGNPELIPERSTNLDLALKFKTVSSQNLNFAGTIAYFNNTISNLINLKWDQAGGDRVGVFENIGRARIHGLELDANLSLKGGWVFAGSFVALEGLDMDSAEILMDMGPVRWNLDLKKYFGGGDFWIGGHIRHSGSENNVATGDLPSEAFTLYDAQAGGRILFGAMLRISAINLFDKDYREFFNLANVRGRGRSFQVSLLYRF